MNTLIRTALVLCAWVLFSCIIVNAQNIYNTSTTITNSGNSNVSIGNAPVAGAQLEVTGGDCDVDAIVSGFQINGNGGSGNEKKLENGNIHAIELSNASGSPIIYQNIPNPFSNGGTKIRYFVPDNTNSPQIVFFDEFGGKLSTFNILETGMGELDVTASNLSSGVYSYSLIINGKAIDTKKMIFQK